VPAFRRLVIETTGLADPAPILHTLIGDPLLGAFYRLDGVITTVDAVNGMSQMDHQIESVKQAAVADRLLVTKSDLVSEAELTVLEARLRQLNPAAPIYRIRQGEISASQLFNAGLYNPESKSLDVQNWLRTEAYSTSDTDAGENHHHHHHGDAHDHGDEHDHDAREHTAHHHDVNRHDDHIRAFCLTHAAPLDWDKFVTWIEMLTATQGANLLRIKGILNVTGEDRPVAIHGIQHLFHPPVVLPDWPSDDRRSRLVFITRDLDASELGKSLADFQNSPIT
jgi:G3E family GTPase